MEKTNPLPWSTHQRFMQKAIQLAEEAAKNGEIPVGALIVKDNAIIGKGFNQVETLRDATAHAEMIAISAACETLDNKYLNGCTLYVTLEPCPMCAGAIVWSKLDTVVFAATDSQSGSCGTIFNIALTPKLNHQVHVIQGILEADSEFLIKDFFSRKRI